MRIEKRAEHLVEQVTSFVAEPSNDATFDHLASEVLKLQLDALPALRRLVQHRGLSTAEALDWRLTPAVPVAAFKRLELHVAPAAVVFRSSGTLGERSVHHQPFPDLYRQVIDASFAAACLPAAAAAGRRPLLSLVPSRQQLPDSSLSFMVEQIFARHGSKDSVTAFGDHGVDIEQATAWAMRRQDDGIAGTILTTAFALVDWLDSLAASDHQLKLPAASTMMETGGFKGRSRELSSDLLLATITQRLGLAASRVVREYGMTELTGHLYTNALGGCDRDLFIVPPWMRLRTLDPISLEPIDATVPGDNEGEGEGLIAVFDLSNVGSVAHVLTQDMGRLEDSALRLLGRAGGAELRGCSLTVEELAKPRTTPTT